jgi:two-component system CheB/CheR fusion protein
MQETSRSAPSADAAPAPLPVVGIGASAGGFPALITLLENMPPSPGMALVVILHLSPHEPSGADRLLQRASAMPVLQVGHPMPVLPDHVYVIPPGRSLQIRDGFLVLGPLERSGGMPATIDIFFRSLAEARRETAVGVVLSGMGDDSTAGLACIRERGGVTIAQLPADAQTGDMPQSAIDSGMADFVLTAAQIPGKLIELRDAAQRIRRRARDAEMPADAPPFDLGPHPQQTLDAVLATLRERTGHDFTQYRKPTLLRRLERRLQVRGLADLPAYAALLKRDGSEAHALLRDLLIGVTRFFRDRDAFDALERSVLPRLFDARRGGELRAWAAACSTGEEAYTLAMLLADGAAVQQHPPRLQVFASDLDAHALDIARAGLYPDAIADDVPPGRLQRHFTREGGRYKVRKPLREMMLFARQNLLQDPAFSRLDLITCRNFLIYLNHGMHRRLLQQFHLALNPGGYLMLGSAESVETAPELFITVDAKHRIFQARPAAHGAQRMPAMRGAPVPAGIGLAPAPPGPRTVPEADAPGSRGRLFSFAEIHLHKAAELAAPSILVDAEAQVVHVSERAARFLRHSGGVPTRDLTLLALAPLRLPLRAALFQAQCSGAESATGPVHYEEGGAARAVEMRILPFRDEHAEGRLMLVQFIEAPPLAQPAASAGPREGQLMDRLEEELRDTRQRLHDTLEEAERAGAEMQAYSEELRTTIEELRTSAEEIDRRRQELESVNLELLTVNRQLQAKVEETAKAHDDLSNLIASSDVATLFLDCDMRILRYTPRIAEIFSVIPTDVGRPLSHLTSRLDDLRLADEAARVFDTLQPTEREARSRDGRHYLVRMLPYRTGEDRIEGVVISIVDVTSRHAAEEALREVEKRHRAELERQVRERTAELQTNHDLLQATMDASMDMIQVFRAVRDEAGAIVDFTWVLNNHASERVFGDVRGKRLIENNPGVVEEGIFEAFRQVVETGAPHQSECHYAHEQFDGWFLQAAVKLGDGVATTTKDITAWKRSQEELLRLRDEIAQAGLQENERRFHALAEEFSQAVWETDAQGKVTSDSPSWRGYTGQTLDQWLGQGWIEAIHPQDRERALSLWREAVAARRMLDTEYRLRNPAGGWRRTHVRAAPLLNTDGSIRKWVGVNIDVDDRRRSR